MSESKFPLCESIGLETDAYLTGYISAHVVESLLSRGVRVWGKPELYAWDSRAETSFDTHTALLIDIREIAKPERKRELSESEVREVLKDCLNYPSLDDMLEQLFGKDGEGGV